MCGIAGIINNKYCTNIHLLVKAQNKRGPDNSCSKVFTSISSALGHNRLSIIDLSKNSNQPFCGNNEKYTLVFNGEIYNYKELKFLLEKKGYTFKTESDTEVVLNSYIEWGADCLKRFRGMFAFVILDLSSSEVFLARDRFGIKPLVYSQIEESLIFASEIKAVLASNLVDRKIRKQAVNEYLSRGSIHQPATFFENIMFLPAGHYGFFNKGNLIISKYWDIYDETKDRKKEFLNLSYLDAKNELRLKLEEATRYHLVSDVKVGAFLSGGIDSTAVVGLMKQIVPTQMDTFTIGFGSDYSNLNEVHYAKAAADFFKVKNTDFVLTQDEVEKDMLDFLHAIDQPTVDGLNTFYASKLASNDVKVVLSGLGGDELFAGYPHFASIEKFSNLSKNGLSSTLFNVLDKLKVKSISGRLDKTLKLLLGDRVKRLSTIRQYFSDYEIKEILNASEFYLPDWEIYRETIIRNTYKEDLDIIDQVSYYEINNYLVDCLLRDSDLMSMQFGLELRPVLLDHDLAEFIFALPSSFKYDGFTHKKIFVDAVEDLLPKEVLNRRKVGFELPLSDWASKINRKLNGNQNKNWQLMILDYYLKSE
jgi:asparagine synthase (glutamine-hydrolysing)